MNIQEMIQKKKEMGYSNQQIADMSGVPLGTVQKIFAGVTTAPRYTTLQALARVFDMHEDILYQEDSGIQYGFVREQSTAYNLDDIINEQIARTKPGSIGDKRLSDFEALPEGTRIELIDGRFYNMAAPTFVHQRIVAMILSAFENFINANSGPCIPSVAPTAVQLDSDDKTVVMPDVLVVCDRDKINRVGIVGAPDLIVEILSPSNWYMDCVIKLKKYKNAGVREYWIVIPDQKKVLVYELEKSSDPTEYTFDDEISVAIWQGKCVVDFRRIQESISFLLGD